MADTKMIPGGIHFGIPMAVNPLVPRDQIFLRTKDDSIRIINLANGEALQAAARDLARAAFWITLWRGARFHRDYRGRVEARLEAALERLALAESYYWHTARAAPSSSERGPDGK
jgi:hypothetical protein